MLFDTEFWTQIWSDLLSAAVIWLPTRAQIGFGLVRSSFIFVPDRQPQFFTNLMGFLNQVFLGVVSGSVTITLPRLRLRTTCPVSHQLRVFCQLKPASNKIVRIVSSLTSGKPSGAFCKA